MDRPKLNVVQKKDLYGDSLLKLDAGSIPSLVGNLSDGVLMVDDEGVIMFVNEMFCQLFGYGSTDLTGASFNQMADILFDQRSLPWVNAKLQKVFNGQKQYFRHNWKTKEGSFLPVEIEISTVYSSSEEIIGGLFVIKDFRAKLLLDISNTLNSTLELAEVLSNTNQIIVERLGLASNGVFLFKEGNSELQLAACNIMHDEMKADISVSVHRGTLGKIITTGIPAYLGNMESEIGTTFDMEGIEDLSIIGYPLQSKGEALGVITFGAPKIRQFSEMELELFRNISSQVAMAVYNAKLYSQLEKISHTDGLTGLYNHKYFKKRLVEELKKAKGKYCVSLLMIDVDNFKQYNDNFGHPIGDQLLEKIAKIFKNSMRECDVVSRYGGEEFAIILVNCDPFTALNTAERLRQAVERYRFNGRELQPGGKLTVSIGMAGFPGQAKSAKKLLELSDAAMYEAKKSKNTVIMAN